MTTIPRTQHVTHAITSLFYPGTNSDRPEPWQRVHMCTCGVELGFDEQGLGACDPDAALAEHIKEATR